MNIYRAYTDGVKKTGTFVKIIKVICPAFFQRVKHVNIGV